MNPLRSILFIAVSLASPAMPNSESPESKKSDLRWAPEAGSHWIPVDYGELRVAAGSALDFSGLVESGPAGKHGFVIVNESGDLVFENRPDEPLRFFSCSEPMEYWRPYTKAEIAEFALQARRAGYNCFRAHFLDLMLMIETTEDGEFNPDQLDRWDYLTAQLKQQGIYLYVDLASTWFAFYASQVKGRAYTPEGREKNLFARMYWDPTARAHWEKGARTLIEHVNPYTGLALKDDPQVITLQLRNEAGIHFVLEHSNKDQVQEKGLIGPFQNWLKSRYDSMDALNADWKTDYKEFSDIPFPALEGVTPPTRDFQRFIVDTELELLNWMRGVVLSTGARQLLIDFNAGNQLALNLTRSALPVVDTHIYHDHPNSYISPGSSMPNRSSAGQGFPFVTWANEVRQLDRPFFVSEWGYPYWNQWRHEAGLSIPAYAAFQGWQMINHAFEPIKLEVDVPPRPFKIGFDPPGRLSERMAALLFARGDVARANHTVAIDLDPDGIFNRLGGQSYLSTAIRRLTLLVRTGIQIVNFPKTLPGAPVEADAKMSIHPSESVVVWSDQPDDLTGTGSGTNLIAALRNRGLLPAGNRTNVNEGIYQSDTGELTLDTKNRTMRVDTPRSQAATLPEGSSAVRLSDTTLLNTGTSVTFFVSAIDDQPIQESNRFLILLVGDAINSNAVFTNKSRQVLVEHGTLPVLARPVQGSLTLHRKLEENEKATLWALAYNGDRIRELPLRIDSDKITALLDSTVAETPVFQYEMRIEQRDD